MGDVFRIPDNLTDIAVPFDGHSRGVSEGLETPTDHLVIFLLGEVHHLEPLLHQLSRKEQIRSSGTFVQFVHDFLLPFFWAFFIISLLEKM